MIQRRARRIISLLWLYLLVGAGVAVLGWMGVALSRGASAILNPTGGALRPERKTESRYSWRAFNAPLPRRFSIANSAGFVHLLPLKRAPQIPIWPLVHMDGDADVLGAAD